VPRDDLNPKIVCFPRQVEPHAGFRLSAGPQFCRAKILENREKSSRVVVVRVRKRDSVNAFDAASPQIRRDNIFADFQLWLEFWIECWDTAAIDEQHPARRSNYQMAVALTDVDGRYLQSPTVIRYERMKIADYNQREGQKRGWKAVPRRQVGRSAEARQCDRNGEL
jgi:hypothetical protein